MIWGGKGMRSRIIERDGWMILREGDAWLGVKGFSRSNPNSSCGTSWDNDTVLRMSDGKAPVVFVAGRAKDFAGIDTFSKYLQGLWGNLIADGSSSPMVQRTFYPSISSQVLCQRLTVRRSILTRICSLIAHSCLLSMEVAL